VDQNDVVKDTSAWTLGRVAGLVYVVFVDDDDVVVVVSYIYINFN
jgi:hypothetical protein